MSIIEYYLRRLGLEESPQQAKLLREIVLSGKSETEVIDNFRDFIMAQSELHTDTITIINSSILTGYGSEYLGLGGDDYCLKISLYKQFTEKFPEAFGLKIHYADCCFMGNRPIEEFYPILKEGMLADKKNVHSLSADLVDFIKDSKFGLEFSMFLLDKYYLPCDQDSFNEYIDDFKEFYTSEEQQNYLNSLVWKDESTYLSTLM